MMRIVVTECDHDSFDVVDVVAGRVPRDVFNTEVLGAPGRNRAIASVQVAGA